MAQSSMVVEPLPSAVDDRDAGFVAAAAAIMARGDEVATPGQWIGLVEIMTFCVFAKRRVVYE